MENEKIVPPIVLHTAVGELLEAIGPYVDETSALKWKVTDGALPLVTRSIVRRQYDCLSIAASLVQDSHGFAAIPMLRPACEEYLWGKYLRSLEVDAAETLVTLMARTELLKALKAQDDFGGRATTSALGLSQYLKNSQSQEGSMKSISKALGKRLHWEKRVIEKGGLPSAAFVAKAVGETKLYNYLYHASSRYVHFSPSELLRRAWGIEGAISVSSSHFGSYWNDFVLYWGVYLLSLTFVELSTFFEDGESGETTIDEMKLLAAAKRIGEFGQIPIITAEELDWYD